MCWNNNLKNYFKSSGGFSSEISLNDHFKVISMTRIHLIIEKRRRINTFGLNAVKIIRNCKLNASV